MFYFIEDSLSASGGPEADRESSNRLIYRLMLKKFMVYGKKVKPVRNLKDV